MNRFIRQQTGTNFDGRWLLVAEWNNVAEYGSTADKVRSMIASQWLASSPEGLETRLVCGMW